MVTGEVLFFTLGRGYAFGLWYGILTSSGLNFFLVKRTLEYVEGKDSGDKVTCKFSSAGLLRLGIYGASLAISTLVSELNFFTAAGGLLLPSLALQASQGLKGLTIGGNDA